MTLLAETHQEIFFTVTQGKYEFMGIILQYNFALYTPRLN